MEFQIDKIAGIGEFEVKELGQGEKIYSVNTRAFCVLRRHTIEVRTDRNLGKLLQQKYESVMASRYFGAGGLEIVTRGQIGLEELYDLVRLSYNLTKRKGEIEEPIG